VGANQTLPCNHNCDHAQATDKSANVNTISSLISSDLAIFQTSVLSMMFFVTPTILSIFHNTFHLFSPGPTVCQCQGQCRHLKCRRVSDISDTVAYCCLSDIILVTKYMPHKRVKSLYVLGSEFWCIISTESISSDSLSQLF
jgi:hypothetical protein